VGLPHRAIIAGLTHEKPHGNVAWEIFYPAGPFALLPLLDDDADGTPPQRAGVDRVGARRGGRARLGDRAFTAEVESACTACWARSRSKGRSVLSAGFHHTAKITAQRLALVGDAAHGIHPIAGQGLNLGLRDVGALVEVLADGARLGLDPGDAQLLKRYERMARARQLHGRAGDRRADRLFGIPARLPSAVRRLGMGAVQRTPLLKHFFMDEARGVSGDLTGIASRVPSIGAGLLLHLFDPRGSRADVGLVRLDRRWRGHPPAAGGGKRACRHGRIGADAEHMPRLPPGIAREEEHQSGAQHESKQHRHKDRADACTAADRGGRREGGSGEDVWSISPYWHISAAKAKRAACSGRSAQRNAPQPGPLGIGNARSQCCQPHPRPVYAQAIALGSQGVRPHPPNAAAPPRHP
jgi:hypothetical protein